MPILLDIYSEVRLLDHMVVLFLIFLRRLHSVFHNSCATFHSLQQHTRVSTSPHPHQHLLSFVFLINIHPNRCEVISHYDPKLIEAESRMVPGVGGRRKRGGVAQWV